MNHKNYSKKLYQEVKRRAFKKRQENLLSQDDVDAIVERSNGCCEITGIPFQFDNEQSNGAFRRPFIPSLDRIDSKQGYSLSNCRLVCAAVNIAMGEWGERVFEQLVAGYRSTKEKPIKKAIKEELDRINSEPQAVVVEMAESRITWYLSLPRTDILSNARREGTGPPYREHKAGTVTHYLYPVVDVINWLKANCISFSLPKRTSNKLEQLEEELSLVLKEKSAHDRVKQLETEIESYRQQNKRLLNVVERLGKGIREITTVVQKMPLNYLQDLAHLAESTGRYERVVTSDFPLNRRRPTDV